MKLVFGDIVVVEDGLIGVIVKSWDGHRGRHHEVYVRSYNIIEDYKEDDIDRYIVRHKYLDDEEKEYQYGNC